MDGRTVTIVTERRQDAIGIYVKALVAALRRRGVTVRQLAFHSQRSRIKGLNVGIEVLNCLRLPRLVRGSDAVLFADPLSLQLLAAPRIAVPTFSLFFHYEQDPWFYRVFPGVTYRDTLDRLDGIICSSKFSVEQLRLLGAKTKRYRIVYGGLDHDRFRPSSSTSEMQPFLLSIGSEEPRKNMTGILRAFLLLADEFPHLRLIKVGRASRENRLTTLRLVKQLGLSARVKFVDFVDEASLPAYYSSAELLVFPSLLEGFGLPVIEAMGCNCPVVTSDLNPMRELAGDAACLVDPRNPKAIADACRRILTRKDYQEQLRRDGCARSAEFTWDRTAAAVDDYIFSVGSLRTIASKLGV